jgi:hypothetical protein
MHCASLEESGKGYSSEKTYSLDFAWGFRVHTIFFTFHLILLFSIVTILLHHPMLCCQGLTFVLIDISHVFASFTAVESVRTPSFSSFFFVYFCSSTSVSGLARNEERMKVTADRLTKCPRDRATKRPSNRVTKRPSDRVTKRPTYRPTDSNFNLLLGPSF